MCKRIFLAQRKAACGRILFMQRHKTQKRSTSHAKIQYRGVAQLVARLVWDQDAAGSIPVTPTIMNDTRVVIRTKQIGESWSVFVFDGGFVFLNVI